MANERYIIIPSGLKPVHSFDNYGPIVDSKELSEQNIKLFKMITESEKISPEDAAKIVNDYRALALGEPWATGKRKASIIDALMDHLQRYPELQPDYKAALQEDCLYVMREILDSGEGVIVFSSRMPTWLKENLPEDITARIGGIYGGAKHRPEAFEKVYDNETSLGRCIVTHTADELHELESAVASGLFAEGKLVFVNRNGGISKSKALAAGIDIYVNDLREVGYAQLVKI